MVVPAFALTRTAPDIVVPNLNDNTFSTVVNVTGTEFARLPVDLPAGDVPIFIAKGDFNEDRLNDLAILNVNGQLTFMLGQGNGSFTPVPVPFNFNYLLSNIAVGDFNNDGHDDILVSDQGSSVLLLLGDGELADNANDHFIAQSPVSIANRANAVAAADFNEDGNLDAIVCDYNGFSIKVLMGDGNGGLINPQSLSAGERPQAAGIGDFNGDGNVDFAVAGGLSQYVSVYLGKGDGTFAPEIQVTTRTGGDGTLALAAGDLNNDGYDDLVTRGGNSNPGEGVLVVRLWSPALNDFVAGGSVSSQGAWLVGLSVADFNGDGNQDVVFANAPVDNNISIYYGDGAGNLGSLKNIAVGNFPNGIAVVDVNPILGDYTTTARISNKSDGPGDVRSFSTDETLYVILEDVKLTKDVIPEIATVKISQTEFPFVASRDGVFTAAVDLDAFSSGDLEVNINFKATVLDPQSNIPTVIHYRRSSKITLVADPLRVGLITYYPLNAVPKNDRVQDVSDKGNDGIVSGAVFTAVGKKGGAFSFDGINDTITGKKGLGTLPTGSLSFWMKSDAVENFRSPFSGLSSAACGNVCTRFEQNNAGQMIVAPLQFQSPGVYAPVQQNQWHHVVLVWSTSQATGYLDGVLQFTVNLFPSNLSFTPVLGAGSFFGGNGPVYFKGLIDELRMYNRQLSPVEVLNLYNI